MLIVLVVALVVIALASVVGPRVGIASPLVLVAIGVGASFVPMLGVIDIRPEWILEGVLPPLLYSSAVSMPSMNFRRDFGAISGLSVLLVIGSSLVLGVFFMLVVPGLGFAYGVALGAIISPTDAVATSLVKGSPISKRVVAMLEGESLLNDATALVLLRTAIVAVSGSFSFWGALGTFAYSVAVAVGIGWLVGWLNLAVRRRVTDPTVNTALSFAVPFVAAIPATLLQASGLVAAVAAGLITGILAPRQLSPENRLSDGQNWRTVELVLEGAVFLIMGLQIRSVVVAVQAGGDGGVATAVLIALGAFGLTVAVRAVYVGPLLAVMRARARANERIRSRAEAMQERFTTPEGKQEMLGRMRKRSPRRSERDLDRFSTRITRFLANLDYFSSQPLGWREGTVVVWAGMRGAVTVAAAQTLPEFAGRDLLVLIAFAVAVVSLVLQGGTIGPVVRALAPAADPDAAAARNRAELDRLFQIMRTAAEGFPPPPPVEQPERIDQATIDAMEVQRAHRIAVLHAQRNALLDERDNGTFDSDVLTAALANLDAAEIDLELRGRLAT